MGTLAHAIDLGLASAKVLASDASHGPKTCNLSPLSGSRSLPIESSCSLGLSSCLDAYRSAMPSSSRMVELQPSTRAAFEQSAVMWGTSPSRYWPVVMGGGPPMADDITSAI